MKEVIPEKQALLKQIRQKHGDKVIQEVLFSSDYFGSNFGRHA